MKKYLLSISVSLLFCQFIVEAQGVWTHKASFSGAARSYAPVGFSIGSIGYIGLGYNGSTYYQDLRAYDQNTDAWTPKTNFYSTRDYSSSFVIDGKAYVGLGNIASINYNDIWEYDTTLNAWSQKANFPGIARVTAVAFAINGKGYVGSGCFYPSYTTVYNDFYEYDPTSNIWTAKANFATMGRIAPVGFALNGKGYLGLGFISANQTDFWEYDPILDTWTQKGNFPGIHRNSAGSFTIGNNAYIAGGYDGSNDLDDFWQWEPVTDTWVQKANLLGGTRTSMSAFSIGNKGYIGCGRTNGMASNTFFEYDPSINVLVDNLKDTELVSIAPNPFSYQTVINFNIEQQNTVIKVSDVLGKEMMNTTFSGKQYTFEKNNLNPGIYFIQLRDENKNITNKKVVIQ